MASIKYVEDPKTGEKYAFRLGYIALEGFKKETGKDFEGGDEENASLEMMEPLFWHGLKAGAEVMDEEFNLERKRSRVLLDLYFFEFLQWLPEFFPNAEKFMKTLMDEKAGQKGQGEKK